MLVSFRSRPERRQPPDDAALDEVTVNGERVKIEAMRKEIVQLEDRFYDRYNELNTIDDFDIHCIEEAKTGTRFIKRSCRAVYQERAFAEEGQAAFKVLQRFREKGPAVADGGPPVPASLTIERRLPEYKKNLEAVTRRDPELARLLEERGKLIEQVRCGAEEDAGRRNHRAAIAALTGALQVSDLPGRIACLVRNCASGLPTAEVLLVVGAARPVVLRHLRMRAQRTRARRLVGQVAGEPPAFRAPCRFPPIGRGCRANPWPTRDAAPPAQCPMPGAMNNRTPFFARLSADAPSPAPRRSSPWTARESGHRPSHARAAACGRP